MQYVKVTSTVYQSNIGIIRPEIADEALVKLREENYRAVKQLLKGGSEETAKDTTHESVVKALEELDRGNSKVLEQVLESAKLTWFDTAQDISKVSRIALYPPRCTRAATLYARALQHDSTVTEGLAGGLDQAVRGPRKLLVSQLQASDPGLGRLA